ncbi:hypothetical protein FACS1894190_08870 [Spirochaetia bacterium]|nr:hypothetical protein FACS1894190_08870 [Spirochaetia bacterium]GHV22337.1 hypothetical protein FACS189494_09030 [Spirochaetia bacterium]
MIIRKKKLKFVETSALSDLAFILIVYFIVIAGFNTNKGLLMNLPAKDSTRIMVKDDILRYEMDNAGDIFFNGEKQGAELVESTIQKEISLNPNLAVVLSVMPETNWQGVVSFVELAERLNVESFSFKMKQDQE